MSEAVFSHELPIVVGLLAFLAFFSPSRLLSRRAYRALSRESSEELKLEFARYSRIFVIAISLLVLEISYLYLAFEEGFRLIVDTSITSLSIILILSQTITYFVTKNSILSRVERRRFILPNISGIGALCSLSVLVVALWMN